MPPELQKPEDPKEPASKFGFGRLPPAFDIAFRWGITLAVAVLLGFLIGRWLDTKLKTTPLFLLIGIFWALGGSFYSIFLQVKKMEKDEKTQDASKST